LNLRTASLAVLLLAAPALHAQAPPAEAPATLRAGIDTAIAAVFPSLVRIHVVGAYYKDGRELKAESAGSGVIVSADGYVVTNHHVAGRAKRLFCTLSDRQEVGATLVGSDPLADIAVIKLDAHPVGKPYPVARFGDPQALHVGDRVLAMGSPLALSQSVTLGIVSNLQMTFPDILGGSGFRLDGEETGTIVRWIGHDAQIFPGNSGGPLVNLAGEVVGINEISYGLSGAIPGDLAHEVADHLIAEGDVKRSWLGLELQPLLKRDKDAIGVLVAGVLEGSPAAAAGLRPGDVLVQYAGHPLKVRYAEQMPEVNRLMLATAVGSGVDVTYRRDGREQRARITTVGRGPMQGDEAELKSWGITARELTLLAAKELKREPGTGVLVSSVRTGAPATTAKPPLDAGDIIVKLDDRAIHSVKDLVDFSAAALSTGTRKPVLVAFERRI
jgi:serine protease Do